MEVLIVIGIVAAFFVFSRVQWREKAGDQLNGALEERIRMNEMRAELTAETGGVDNEQLQQIMKTTENMEPDTFNLVQTILKDLGCQPEKDGDNTLQFAYQGENFQVNTGGYYARIWDPGWAHMNVNDPNFEKMKEASNVSNFEFGPTIVWTSPDENGVVVLHSKSDVLLHPAIPDKKDYFRFVLKTFFETKERMRNEFISLINQSQQKPKSHRPVGFVTDSEE